MINKIVRIKFEKWQCGYENLHNKIGFLPGKQDCYGDFIIDLEDGGWACVHRQNLEILKFKILPKSSNSKECCKKFIREIWYQTPDIIWGTFNCSVCGSFIGLTYTPNHLKEIELEKF